MAKKNIDRGAAAKENAMALLESRRPSVDYGGDVFVLKTGVKCLISPKMVFTDKTGNKTKIRYHQSFNSIFEDEQDDEGVRLTRIPLNKKTVITDPLLRDYLLLRQEFGKAYELIDPAKNAKLHLEQLETFDTVWDSVRDQTTEGLKSLNLMLTNMTLTQMSTMTVPELKLSLRAIAEKNPGRVKEALADPIIKTLYLYHMGVSLGEIKYMPRREAVVWTDSNQDLCKVPINKDPGLHTARLLLTDEYLSAREMLEKKIND